MKQNWEEKRLGDLCEFRNGLWKGKKPPFITAKVIRMTNFTKECEMNNLAPIELEVEKKQFDTRYLIDGDLLLEKSGGGPNQPVGRVVRFEEKVEGNYSFSNFTTRIRIINQNFVNSNYLHKYLKYFYLVGKTEPLQNNSTNIRNLQLPAYKDVFVPIPPLEKQKRIVAKLDQCFESIDKAKANVEKNLQNAKDLFQSQLNEIFSQKRDGWVEKKLSEVFIFRQGIQRGVKLQTEVKRGSQVRFLRIVDYTQGNEPPRYIDNPGKEYMMSDDDIALVRYGASTGFVCNGYEGALANNLFRVIPKDEYDISLKYLYYFLKSPSFQGVIHKAMNGAAMPAISFGLINDIPFPLTQRAEQDELASIIEDVELKCLKVITNYQQELDALDELKKSILEKAFNGEL